MARVLLFLLSSMGIVVFLLFTSVAPFKNKVFSTLYDKPLSQASEGPNIPLVELTAEGFTEKKINLEPGKKLTLNWKTSNVDTCIGRAWGGTDKDMSWSEEKDPNGGLFETPVLSKNNTYVYVIDCANEFGDAAGDAVVVNVGAYNLSQLPYITTFEVTKTQAENPDKIISFIPGENLQINWSTLNLGTPYSICFASGSWPAVYQNSEKAFVSENFTLERSKVYRYSLFCSNEAGITKKVITLSPR